MDVLIVEDGFLTATFIKSVLNEQGITTADIVDNAIDAQELFSHTLYDIVFMDINIKGGVDGIELGVQLHKKYKCKIIFITSYQDSQTIHEASFANPIGYLVKPVVQADIESIMMIAKKALDSSTNSDLILISGYTYDKATKTFTKNDKSIKLSKLESKALYLLVKNKNAVVDNEQLKAYLWGEERSDSTLRELIYRIRKKTPDLDIQKCSNIGYVLKVEE
jgi:DNA-binding response OmpR family regulator